MNNLFTDYQIYAYEEWLGTWVFWTSMLMLGLESIRYLFKRKVTWNMVGDSIANFVTYYAFIGIIIATFTLYVSGYYYVSYYFSITELPINGWTILIGILLADITYYWEHRATHRIGIGWATHTVHHSSPYFNISVAYRFGPLDAVESFIFHIPMLVIGFDPAIVFLSAAIVLQYQTFLHTEAIGKLPKLVEAIMNTPSHHRVHHGANLQYIDKNYAAMFIIWDRMFGTFAEEREKVDYGVTEPIHSINPLVLFFHGFVRLFRQMWVAKGIRNKLGYLVMPPDWSPHQE